MYKLRFLLSVAVTLFFSLALCSIAQAGAGPSLPNRTFVSITGDDANDCLNITPCRNFQRAHDAVADGGEVVALTSGGYGAFTITKNVTISGEGYEVESSAAAGDAITIATAGINVVLRSISIEGFRSGGIGINVSVGVNLTLQHCVINGFTGAGLNFVSSGGKLSIDNSKITNCGGNGITLNGSGGTAVASISSSRIENSGVDGLSIDGAKVTIRNSVTSNNVGAGMSASGTSQLNVEACESSTNGASGILMGDDTSTVRVSRSVVTNNGTYGFDNSGGGNFLSRVDVIASAPVLAGLKVVSPKISVGTCNTSTGSPIFSNTVEGNTTSDFNGTIAAYCSK